MASRLISDSMSRSNHIATLSPKALALFCLLLPHLNAHGKMAAEINTVKGLVCPKIRWLTPRVIRRCLEEITNTTSMKWFEADGLHYLHALHFHRHQPGLRWDRMGEDRLPSYSRTGPGVLPDSSVPEVEVEVEVKKKEKRKEVEGNGNNPVSLSSLEKAVPPPEPSAQHLQPAPKLERPSREEQEQVGAMIRETVKKMKTAT